MSRAAKIATGYQKWWKSVGPFSDLDRSIGLKRRAMVAGLKAVDFFSVPFKLDGGSFEVPSGHTLMDEGSFRFTAEKRNQGKTVPHQAIHFGKETLYLVHHSFCHPDQLFLPQGAYTQTGFSPLNLEGVSHLQVRGDKIFIFEVQLPVPDASYNLLEQLPIVPQTVVVQLKEGGHVTLKR